MGETLPDFIAADLRILSIGLNPSIPSVEAGFYFANPRNRFWSAFQESPLARTIMQPSADYHRYLLRQESIGFTDVVKRASRQGHELRSTDFKTDAPKLQEKLKTYRPLWAWFHGKVAYRNFLRYALNEPSGELSWGLQAVTIEKTRIFVTPNPSPANAAWSLSALQECYREFATHVV